MVSKWKILLFQMSPCYRQGLHQCYFHDCDDLWPSAVNMLLCYVNMFFVTAHSERSEC